MEFFGGTATVVGGVIGVVAAFVTAGAFGIDPFAHFYVTVPLGYIVGSFIGDLTRREAS